MITILQEITEFIIASKKRKEDLDHYNEQEKEGKNNY